MRMWTGLAGLFSLTLATNVQAEQAAPETRVAEAGFESPAATIDQVDWLIGQWEGTGIGGAPAKESWLIPSGGTMVGTFVQETAEGGIMFTEHMYLMEEGGSLVVKLKHFNADLTGWEDKEGMVTFRLLSLEPCAAYFQALTFRCTTPEEGEGGLMVAVRMKSEGPDVKELTFRFERNEPDTQPARCQDAMTTVDMNDCYGEIYARALAQKNRHLDAALKRHEGQPAVTDLIRASDMTFEAYRKSECGAVWENWSDGSIRTIMSVACSIELTDRRTQTIWENWLTFMDSTPPVLPEPKPTQ